MVIIQVERVHVIYVCLCDTLLLDARRRLVGFETYQSTQAREKLFPIYVGVTSK